MKTVRMLSIALLAATGLLASALATPVAASGRSAPDSTAAAPVKRCATIGFDSANVTLDLATRSVTLTVSGMAPSTNVTVDLSPVVYIQQPEYWTILVQGCSAGIGQPVLTPYVVSRDISSTIGTVGIEVQGSNRKVQIPLRSPHIE